MKKFSDYPNIVYMMTTLYNIASTVYIDLITFYSFSTVWEYLMYQQWYSLCRVQTYFIHPVDHKLFYYHLECLLAKTDAVNN